MFFTFRKKPQTTAKSVTIKRPTVKKICMYQIMISKNIKCSSCGH